MVYETPHHSQLPLHETIFEGKEKASTFFPTLRAFSHKKRDFSHVALFRVFRDESVKRMARKTNERGPLQTRLNCRAGLINSEANLTPKYKSSEIKTSPFLPKTKKTIYFFRHGSRGRMETKRQ